MNKCIWVLFFLIFASKAMASGIDCKRLYIGVFGGENRVKKCHKANIYTKFDKGILAGGVIGYRFDTLRLEGEFAYRRNKLTQITFLNQKYDYDVQTNIRSYLVNVCYDLKISSLFTPYVGFGFGYVDSSFKTNIQGVKVSDKTNGMASQYLVGFDSFITKNISVGMEYRYLDARAHLNDHGITLSMKYNL